MVDQQAQDRLFVRMCADNTVLRPDFAPDAPLNTPAGPFARSVYNRCAAAGLVKDTLTTKGNRGTWTRIEPTDKGRELIATPRQ